MKRLAAAPALLALMLAPAVAQPPVPATEMKLVPPTPVVEGFVHVDTTTESIDLTSLRGEPVYSSKTMGRIGHVDDVYVDSVTGTTFLGLEIGGLFEIGDKEIVITLDEMSVYRQLPVIPDPYSPVAGTPAMTDEADEETEATMRAIEEERREYLEKFAYRYANYRLYVDASKEDLEDYPEFDLY